MNNMVSRRSRIVFILDYLKRNSDENHPVDAQELLRALEENGLSAERKAIYEDIKALALLGYDIIKSGGNNRGYFIGEREFEIPEINLLMDAVQSADFISENKTRRLLSKLQNFVSRFEADGLKNRVFVENRSKCSNEAVYRIISDINEAISANNQIEIEYAKTQLQGNKLTNTSKKMIVNPYALVWDADRYYLIGNNAKYDNLTNLRVDRIKSLKILATKMRHFSEVSEYSQRFDVADYSRKTFNMFGGELCRIDLECDVELLDQIIDRFSNVIMIRHFDGEKTFRFSTEAHVSDGLVGWIMQFGGKIKVLSPESLKNDVKEKISCLARVYGN